MKNTLTDLSKEVFKKDVMGLLDDRYSVIGPIWTNQQMEWSNGIYRTFNDHDKYMIVVYLIKKTLDFYSKNFIKLNYDEFYSQDTIAIGKFNITDISFSLNIPKETTRRKINELEKLGTIKRINKKFIIDRNTWPNIKPENTIKRMTRFLSTFSKMLYSEGSIPEPISSERLTETCKEYFSHVWKLYYEMQLPFLLDFKKVFGDLESFHVYGICITNHALNSKKNDNSEISKKYYIEKYFFNNQRELSGLNAMSISDITGIPRATVIRKLNKLVKEKFLKLDSKKHYSTTGINFKKVLDVQKITLNNLANFAARIYNFTLMKGN